MFKNVRKLIGSKRSAATPVPTQPVQVLGDPPVSEERFVPPHFRVGFAQDVGLQRDHNEDALFTLSAAVGTGDKDIPFGVYIVADGMGGHLNGELASAAAVRAMSNTLLQQAFPRYAGFVDEDGRSIHEILETAVWAAQEAVLRAAPGGGTTLTACLILGDRVSFAHVGDSRGYFYRASERRLEVMTQDHSLVHRLQELGQISELEASVHPQRNVLYRALGQSEPFRPDLSTHVLPPDGGILLCSDGLWGVISQETWLRILEEHDEPFAACQALVEAANAVGGPDNISVVYIKVDQVKRRR